MSEIPFSEYGFITDDPPELQTAWNEQKRIVDLSQKSYVFITSLYSSPWRQRERFPNADHSTMFYYWSKWADKRIKFSCHWQTEDNRWPVGSIKSRLFGQRYA